MRAKSIWNIWTRLKWEAKLANLNRTPLMEINLQCTVFREQAWRPSNWSDLGCNLQRCSLFWRTWSWRARCLHRGCHKLAKVNQLKTQTQNHTKILFQQFLEFIKVMKKHVNSSSSWLNLFQGLRTCKSSMGPSGNCKELLSQASSVKCQRGLNKFKS